MGQADEHIAAPRLGQLEPGVRGSVASVEVAAVQTLPQQSLPSAQLLPLLLDDPLQDAILDHAGTDERAEGGDAPAVDPQYRRDVADQGTGGDDEAQAKTWRHALRETADMHGQIGLETGEGGRPVVEQRPIDVVLDDQDVVASGDLEQGVRPIDRQRDRRRIVKNSGKNFKIVWDGQGMDFNPCSMPKGLPHHDLAEKFVAFTVTPEVMAQQSKYISYGPTLKDAIPLVPDDILIDLQTAPENTKNAFVVSSEFWADHDEELTERFNNWLAQ